MNDIRLAISNIGWEFEQDLIVYCWMKQYGFTGLEIAPTRIFPETPYEKLNEASVWAENLKRTYGFTISSIQSIWFGHQEKLFGSEEERLSLIDYTKKAIDFASAISCHNLVFGCPRNRDMPEGADENIAVVFFKEIGDYAASKGTVIGMEANPPIYNTNYINDTKSAFELIEKVESDGFKLNLDLGTMIENRESIEMLIGKVSIINHVHISEPGLKPIQERMLHKDLKQLLLDENYNGYVSIEMSKSNNLTEIENAIRYVGGLYEN